MTLSRLKADLVPKAVLSKAVLVPRLKLIWCRGGVLLKLFWCPSWAPKTCFGAQCSTAKTWFGPTDVIYNLGQKHAADNIVLLTRMINLSWDNNCTTTRMFKLSISSIASIIVTAFIFLSIQSSYCRFSLLHLPFNSFSCPFRNKLHNQYNIEH